MNFKNKLSKFRKSRLFILAVLLLVLVLTSVFVLVKSKITERQPVETVQAANYFTVVNTTPEVNSSNNAVDNPIIITFSEPVDPSSLHGYFTVNPMIPGTFTQGFTKNQVVFTPRYPFGSNTSVKVILNKGFESVSGDKFTSDFSFNFYTTLENDTIEFSNNNSLFSRLTNLSVGQSTTFTLQGQSSENGTLTIYKGTFDQFVSSMLYKNAPQQGTNYVEQDFIDYPVDTSKMQKISQETGFTSGQDLDFKEPAGLYYIEAKGGSKRFGFTWVNVTDEGLIVKEDDQKIAVATQNTKTGNNNFQANILLYNLEDKPTLLSAQQVSGYAEFPVQYPQQVDLVVGQTSEGIILAPVSIPQTQADIRVTKNLSNTDKIFITTDKPAYLQGNIVRFSGFLREDNDAIYTLPSNQTNINIWINNPQDNSKQIFNQTVNVDANGNFSGEFTLPSSLTPDDNTGTYISPTLYAKEVKSNAFYTTSSSYTTFDVVTKNNTGLITVSFDKDKYIKNEKITAHIQATDLTGNPIANKEINYTVYAKNYYENDPESAADFGNDWGETSNIENQIVKLDQNGKADIDIDESQNTVSEAVTLVASDDIDNILAGAKTVLVQQGNLILTFGTGRQNYYSGDNTLNRVYVTDLSGNPVANQSIDYEIYNPDFDVSQKQYNEANLGSGNVTTNSNGYAEINQIVNAAPGGILLRVTTKDNSGNEIKEERPMSILDKNNDSIYGIYYHELELTNLDVTTDKKSYSVGDQAQLTINSPFDQNVLITYERGRIYYHQWFTLHKGENNYTINITPELAPSFNVVFSYFENGSQFTEGLPLNVSNPARNLQLSITKNGDNLLISAKDANNNPVQASLVVNVLDNNIFGLRNNLPSGDINWFFNQPRNDTTNFSSSILGIGSGGGCGGGSGTDINYVPNRLGDSLYWNPNLQTDQNGNTTISLPPDTSAGKVFVYAATNSTAVAQTETTF